jgi:hypothetical protein
MSNTFIVISNWNLGGSIKITLDVFEQITSV